MNKKLIYILLFVVFIAGVVFITNRVNQNNVSYKSEASGGKHLFYSIKMTYPNNTCTQQGKNYRSMFGRYYSSLGQCASAIGMGADWKSKINYYPNRDSYFDGKCNNYGNNKSYIWVCYDVLK